MNCVMTIDDLIERSEHTGSVHSANVPNKAAKASGNASTAVVSYHTVYYCFTHSIAEVFVVGRHL